jgi:hypothetical protein
MTANTAVATWRHDLGGGRYLEMTAFAERAAICPVCAEESIFVRRTGLYIHDHGGTTRCCHAAATDRRCPPLGRLARSRGRPGVGGQPSTPAAAAASSAPESAA